MQSKFNIVYVYLERIMWPVYFVIAVSWVYVTLHKLRDWDKSFHGGFMNEKLFFSLVSIRPTLFSSTLSRSVCTDFILGPTKSFWDFMITKTRRE